MLGKGCPDVYLPCCGLHGPLHSRWILTELVFVLSINLVVVTQSPDIVQTLGHFNRRRIAFVCLIKFIECTAETASVYKRVA